MRRTIHKVFFAWSYEEEEKWLNKMSAAGLQLVDVGFCRYVFEEGVRGEYIYRLEMLEDLPSHPRSVAYINFLEETGAQHIGTLLRWVYFRKKATDGPFDLYSDLGSRIKHYRRILVLLLAVSPITVINLWRLATIDQLASIPLTLISLLLAILLGVGVFSIIRKVRRLTKEQAIRE